MNLSIAQLNIVIDALHVSHGSALTSAYVPAGTADTCTYSVTQIATVLAIAIEERDELQMEEQHNQMEKLELMISKACPWATTDAIQEYLLGHGMEFVGMVGRVEHFKKTLLG